MCRKHYSSCITVIGADNLATGTAATKDLQQLGICPSNVCTRVLGFVAGCAVLPGTKCQVAAGHTSLAELERESSSTVNMLRHLPGRAQMKSRDGQYVSRGFKGSGQATI